MDDSWTFLAVAWGGFLVACVLCLIAARRQR